jgi:hypothetical protein
MLTLWVEPGGLQRNTDPNKPTLQNISEPRLAQIADRVIVRTWESSFLLKDKRDNTRREWLKDKLEFEGPEDYRVFFCGRTLQPAHYDMPPEGRENFLFCEMKRALERK